MMKTGYTGGFSRCHMSYTPLKQARLYKKQETLHL